MIRALAVFAARSTLESCVSNRGSHNVSVSSSSAWLLHCCSTKGAMHDCLFRQAFCAPNTPAGAAWLAIVNLRW